MQYIHTHEHTHPFNGPLSETTRVSRYQKGTINLDFTEARDSGWQWHQLGHLQVCISLQTDNHASTPSLSFLQAACPSCHPTYSVKALKKLVERSPIILPDYMPIQNATLICTGWVKKVSCCTVIDISPARQLVLTLNIL